MMSATTSHHDSDSPLAAESGVHAATGAPKAVLVGRTKDNSAECQWKSIEREIRPSNEDESMEASLSGEFVATSDDYYKVITNG